MKCPVKTDLDKLSFINSYIWYDKSFDWGISDIEGSLNNMKEIKEIIHTFISLHL